MKDEYDALDVTGSKFNNRKRLSSDYVAQIVQRDRAPTGSEAFLEFNKLFDRYDLADEAFLKFQEAVVNLDQA